MLVCALMGFSSGMPLFVLVSLLPAWLRTEGMSLASISAFSWLKLPYTWKFLWAPLLDLYAPFGFGRHRGTILCTQAALLALIGAFGWFAPRESITAIAVLAGVVALTSATQDIAIDGYRRELLEDAELGLGNAVAVNAYRVAGLVPGGLALVLTDHLPWSSVYWIVASFMAIGTVGTLLAPNLPRSPKTPTTLRAAVVGPFKEFFTRGSIKDALLVLAFLLLYKFGDNLATTLLTPFYIDLGFSRTEIGTVVKLTSLWSTIVGSLIGGLVMGTIGINRALWIFGAVQLLSIFGLAALSEIGKHLGALVAAVVFEYLGIGLGTSAFVAFMARTASKHFSATQYALFSSFVAIPGVVAGAFAGNMIEAMGYTRFYFLCAALAVPGMLLLLKVAPWHDRAEVKV
jgi:PAT family beta-lactamase induction signal transducer AmpG